MALKLGRDLCGVFGAEPVPIPWRVEARIPSTDVSRVRDAAVMFPRLEISEGPAASGPEAAVMFNVVATTGEIAERVAVRRLSAIYVMTLATRSREA